MLGAFVKCVSRRNLSKKASIAIGTASRFEIQVLDAEEAAKEAVKATISGNSTTGLKLDGWENVLQLDRGGQSLKLIEGDGEVVKEDGEAPLLSRLRLGEEAVVFVPAREAYMILSGGSGTLKTYLPSESAPTDDILPTTSLEDMVTLSRRELERLRLEGSDGAEAFLEGSEFRSVPRLPGKGYGETEVSVELPKSFWASVSDGDLEAVTQSLALDARLAVATHEEHGASPLHAWVQSIAGDDEALVNKGIDLFLRNGASIDAASGNGSTPLHWAAGAGHLPAVQALVARGAKCTARSFTWRRQIFGRGSGQLPLHWAAESGHQHVVEWLASQSPVAIALRDERGKSAADVARTEGHMAIAKSLESQASEPLVALKIANVWSGATIL